MANKDTSLISASPAAVRVSIIVPIAPNEISWLRLIQDFKPLKDHAEIILVCSSERQKAIIENRLKTVDYPLRVITADAGRAQHLNAGARAATGEFLWFVHADSQIPYRAAYKLLQQVDKARTRVFYFDLKFFPDGPRQMEINEWGVWFRSRCFRAPFGDQAFLVARDLFQKIGEYPESAPYGEDHLWIWQAHLKGIPVKPLRTVVLTSARKYQQGGWLATTRLHLRLFAKQYLQQLWRKVRRCLAPLDLNNLKL